MSVKLKYRTFTVDGDMLKVQFRFDELWGIWLGDYPYFADEPRYTPSGKPWKGAADVGCTHYEGETADGCCGSCRYYIREKPADMIGVCDNGVLCKKYNQIEDKGGSKHV